ncbi:MAG: hypothetical protein NT165_02675 [Candidatus Falkowbacteria bacterium]|nr:hypothetical protein [Candidatus Falkowbacteria bacterium]
MKIFKGWFFYLLVAIVMVVIATFASSYYSRSDKNNDAAQKLLAGVPVVETKLGASLLPRTNLITSSSKQDLSQKAKEAAQKALAAAPKDLQFASGFKGVIFRYLSQKKLILADRGFYFTEGSDKKWDFGYKTDQGPVKLFSLKP